MIHHTSTPKMHISTAIHSQEQKKNKHALKVKSCFKTAKMWANLLNEHCALLPSLMLLLLLLIWARAVPSCEMIGWVLVQFEESCITGGRKVTQLTLDWVIYIIEIIRQNYTQMHSIFLHNLEILMSTRENA